MFVYLFRLLSYLMWLRNGLEARKRISFGGDRMDNISFPIDYCGRTMELDRQQIANSHNYLIGF